MNIISCENCRDSLILFIDNEIDDSATFNAIAFHLQDCAACRTAMELERQAIAMIRALLTRSCCETAPQSLHERVVHQLHELESTVFTQVITQYRRTEITIDGETQIEIETSREIRRDFPLQ